MAKAKEEKVVVLEVKPLFERILGAQAIEDAKAKEIALSLLKEECESLEKLKSDVTGKWVIDNDPAILNAHQVREQAVVLVPAASTDLATETEDEE